MDKIMFCNCGNKVTIIQVVGRAVSLCPSCKNPMHTIAVYPPGTLSGAKLTK